MEQGQRAYELKELLKASELKATPLRLALLNTFLKTKTSYSQADLIEKIETVLPGTDRVSIYRNLLQFIDAGLIHEVEKNHYVSCAHECEKHPHFLLFCGSCEKHEEVHDHSRVNHLLKTLSELNFFALEQTIQVKGLCSKCQKSS